MKTCPYCAEEIKDEAIRCRWCLTWLVEEIPAGAEAMPRRAEPAPMAEPAMAEPAMAEPAMAEPAMAEPAMAEPAMAEAAMAEAAMAEPAMAEAAPTPMEQVTAEPAPTEPIAAAAAAEPTMAEPTPAEQPSAEQAPAEAAPGAAAPEQKIEFTHTGTRYLLGYGGDYFGIWDRNAPQQPVERFPRTDDGWGDAWARYSAIESNWMDLRTGQKSG